jgi:hypothetical protein
MSTYSDQNGIIFNHLNPNLEKMDCSLKYENTYSHYNNPVVNDFHWTEKYLLLQYEKEIEILSFKDSLKFI